MTTTTGTKLERRVIAAAGEALEWRQHVSEIDVFVGVGWLSANAVRAWKQGRIPYLEGDVQVDRTKMSAAIEIFRRWAREHKLEPTEAAYVARTRDRHELRFSADDEFEGTLAYRIHWITPALPEAKRARLIEKQRKPDDLVVISPLKDWACSECGGAGELLIMEGDGPLCLQCADMDHLVFLGAGNAALTRRAKKASTLSAVVVRFSRTRKRYERQGILVEESALDQAERQCFDDEEARARRRERDRERREPADAEFQDEFAAAITAAFPGCPKQRAAAIARHAAERGSGRIGRTAAGRALNPTTVELAVVASVRHEDTDYDELLMTGVPRPEARQQVRDGVDEVLARWQG